jgi:hypothetical protein
VDQVSLKYSFCPGKATWYPEVAKVFEWCRIALETGILPEEGSYLDQPALFVEVFPTFVERWRERSYQRVWLDISEFSPKVIEAFGKLFGKIFGGGK